MVVFFICLCCAVVFRLAMRDAAGFETQAFEDQSVRNAENLYSAYGVNVNSAWRAGHRKRAIAGFFGAKNKASSSAPSKVFGAAVMEQELSNGSHKTRSSPPKPVAQTNLDDDNDLSIVNQLFVDSDDDSDPKELASPALQNTDNDEVVILGSDDDVGAGASAISQVSPGMAARGNAAGQVGLQPISLVVVYGVSLAP